LIQDPWIQNATLRENILVNQQLDAGRYQRTIEVCALAADLRTLPGGDQAEIGEKGINLSGGQKHRVALARAVYSDADIYLLDDPLSAVDTHVGRHLFDRCICGHLKEKTRVLVTHQLQFVPAADAIVVMKGGRVAEYGTYEGLRAKGVDFAQFEDQQEERERAAEGAVEVGSSQTDSDGPKGVGHSVRFAETVGGDVAVDMETDLGQSNRLVDRTNEGVETMSDMDSDGPQIVWGGHPEFCGGGVDIDGVATLKEDAAGNREHAQELELMKLAQHSAEPSTGTEPGTGAGDDGEKDLEGTPLLEAPSGKADDKPAEGVGGDSALVQEEARAVGRVKRAVYLQYIAAWGPGFWVPVLVLSVYTVSQTSKLLTNAWLAVWTEGIRTGRGSSNFYLTVYASMSVLTSALVWARGLALAAGCVTAGRNLHTRLLDRVLQLPMSFFDSTPTGRLVNRFTRDTEQVDLQLPDTFGSYLTCLFQVVFELLIILYVTPLFIIPLVPLLLVYAQIQDFYIASSRELKRLDSVARSPIFAHFGESIQGLATIRAFRMQRYFMGVNEGRVDTSTRAYYATLVTNRWLGLRLEMLGSLTVFGTALFAVWAHHPDAGFAGLALTSALSITGYMNWMVRRGFSVSEYKI
jgi:ATP-binding cassette subfamily C (CFTR/MRP) protein 1